MHAETDSRDEPPKTSLGRMASSSAVVSAAGQGSRVLLQTASIIILARLLSPEDYGILAIAVAISAIAEMVRDFGLANASVQSAHLSRAERDNLFWVNTMLGLVLGAMAFVLAPFAGDLFGNPAVGDVLRVLSFGFVVNGIATQPRASLVRSLRFVALNVIDTLALLASVVLAIALAIAGAGPWALAYMLLSQSVIALIGVAVAARWVPRLPQRGVSIRRFVGFGAGMFGTQLLSYATKNANTFIIGLTVGIVPLGFYNRAYQLLNLPLAQLQAPATQVALPVLSRLASTPERFNRFLLHGQTILIHVTSSILTLSGALATPLFALALGTKWIPAAPIFQILALSGLSMVATYATYWVFMARGVTGSQFRLSLIIQPLTIAAVLGGSFFGIYGVIVAYAVANALTWPFTLWWLGRATDVPVRAMFANGLCAIVVYGSAGAVALLTTFSLGTDYVLRLALGVGAYVIVVGFWTLVWRRFRQALGAIAGTRHLLRAGR